MSGRVRFRGRQPPLPPRLSPHFITKRRLIASLARPLFLHFVHSGIVLPLFDEDRSGERDGVEFDGARVRQTKTGKRGADGGGPVRPSVRRSGEVGQQLLIESRDDPKFAMILARKSREE